MDRPGSCACGYVTRANIARGSCASSRPCIDYCWAVMSASSSSRLKAASPLGRNASRGRHMQCRKVQDSLVLGGPFNPSFRRPPSDAQNSHRRCCHRQHRRALELPLNHCPNDFIVLSVHVFQSCIALLWQMGHTAEQSPRPREVPQ
jgi:hypothetical protein